MDIYVTKGPEYVLVSSKELPGAVPKEGSGIELMLRGLRFHPSWR